VNNFIYLAINQQLIIMKKKNVKSLGLNKKAISKLQGTELKGRGWTASCWQTCYEESCRCTDTWCILSFDRPCPR
jgi:hypothetical protein